MLPELQTLRGIQSLDMQIAGCDQALSRVPAEIAEIDREIEAVRTRWTAAEDARAEASANRRRAEGELEDAEAAVSKYSDQLLGARSNVEYSGLQQQIASTKKRIGDLEEQILGLLDDGDRLEERAAAQKREFEQSRAALETRKDGVRTEAREQERRRKTLRSDREARSSGLSPELSARYERIRQARHGLAIARAQGERCGACNVRLRPQLFEEVRTGEAILNCESCSRILFFEPEPAASPA